MLANSDIISIFALAISIMTGILNFYYTRRSFEAEFFPKTAILVREVSCSLGTCLLVKVRNLSKDKTIVDGILTVNVIAPRFGSISCPKQKVNWILYKNIVIEPDTEKTLTQESSSQSVDFETLLSSEFNYFILGDQSKLLLLKGKVKKIRLNLQFQYSSGILEKGYRRVKKTFYFTPRFSSTSEFHHRIDFWSLE